MKKFTPLINFGFLIAVFSLFTSCEETGDPLTLDDIYDATVINREPFEAKINGFDFKADAVSGGKEGDSYFIVGALNDGASITIRTQNILAGTYLGIENPTNNIFYKNEIGRLFDSNFPAEDSDAEITILAYSEVNSLATGIFSGTLYSTDSDEKLSITNGAFNFTLIQIPFTGKMKAFVNQRSFNSEDCSFVTTNNGGITFQEIVGVELNDSLEVSILIEDSLAVGTYDFMDSGVNATYNSNVFSPNLPKHQFNAISGNLVVNRVDYIENKVIGSFNFEAVNLNGETVNVNNGGFQALVK